LAAENADNSQAAEPIQSALAPDPIVVYGAPRSGTTYLERILNSHPAVFISHESRVFAWLYKALEVLPEDDLLVLSHREAFVDYLRTVFPGMIRDFYGDLAPEVRYWGDKNPHYADYRVRGCLEMIAELYPGSRFIHIIRDGRDVVTSLLRKKTDGRAWATFEEAHATWKWSVDLGRKFGQQLSDNRYFELRYEDLVDDDAGVAKEIFGFLAIDFDPAVEAFCLGQQAKRTPFKDPTRDWKKGVTESEWAATFSPEEQAQSLELIGQDLVWYGYETEKSLAQLRQEHAEVSGTSADD
jgi:hypothetical protein